MRFCLIVLATFILTGFSFGVSDKKISVGFDNTNDSIYKSFNEFATNKYLVVLDSSLQRDYSFTGYSLSIVGIQRKGGPLIHQVHFGGNALHYDVLNNYYSLFSSSMNVTVFEITLIRKSDGHKYSGKNFSFTIKRPK